jgi:hypothetical protein
MDTKPHNDFQILIDGVAVAVRYTPRYFGDHDHFAFTDASGRRKPIPISRTGYRSHFVHASFVEQAGTPEVFAKAYAAACMEQRPNTDDEAEEGRQGSLFD